MMPEEFDRAHWDHGCADWAPDLEPLKIDVARSGGDLRVTTRLAVWPERGESVDDTLASVAEGLNNEKTYNEWVMPGINDKPGGGKYFVTMDALKDSFDPRTQFRELTGNYKLKVLWFERDGVTTMLFKHEYWPLPDCTAFKEAVAPRRFAYRYLFRMLPREDILKRLVTEIWVFRTKDHVELRLRLVSTPSKILYELLPDNYVRSQITDRARRLWENFVDFRRSAVFAKGARRGTHPGGPAAAPRDRAN